MSLSPIIRALEAADLSALLTLYEAHLFEEGDLPRPGEERLREVWGEIVHNPRTTYVGAFVDTSLVAACAMITIPNLTRGASPYAVIENVVTHRGFRGKGLATAVLRCALDTAWKGGCYKVMLLSSVHRTAAHGLYQKVGFVGDQKVGFIAKPPR